MWPDLADTPPTLLAVPLVPLSGRGLPVAWRGRVLGVAIVLVCVVNDTDSQGRGSGLPTGGRIGV